MIFFKSLALLFILNNLYYLINYKRLDKPFYKRDRNSLLDLFFYINKVLFIIWIIFGFFTTYQTIMFIISILILFRIPIFYVNKKLYSLIYRLTPPILIILILLILIL